MTAAWGMVLSPPRTPSPGEVLTLEQQDELERRLEPRPRTKRPDWISEQLKATFFYPRFVLESEGRWFCFWRVYPDRMVVIDALATGETSENTPARDEICKANGYTRVAFPKGNVPVNEIGPVLRGLVGRV